MKQLKDFLIKLCVIAVLLSPVVWIICSSNHYTENTYSLSALNDGIYGMYTCVSSSVPADNYEMITLCLNGSVYTFKGDIHICYTDVAPHAIIHDYNIVNGDEIYVYVPYESIVYNDNIGV